MDKQLGTILIRAVQLPFFIWCTGHVSVRGFSFIFGIQIGNDANPRP